MTLDDRAKRIVDTAVMLAERDGFAAVRLRDVAATAQVALGTVYKRFSSKEEILIAALEQESERLRERYGSLVPEGESPEGRIVAVITVITQGFCRKPNLARALIRAIASGNPNVTDRVAHFHATNTELIIAALRGEPLPEIESQLEHDDPEANEIASTIQHVWFASLVSWAGGIYDVDTVIEHVAAATKLLLSPAAAA